MNLLVGTDIESVDRFNQLLKSNKNYLRDIFFESEYDYAIRKVNSDQSLTGIWCAKEAVVKSFNAVKLITIRNVEIICTKNGSPKAIIRNTILKDLKFNISLSISHTREYATAVAVLTIIN